MNKQHYPLIRTIYLYVFALVGLILVIIASVRFLDMGLKYFIFTEAEQEQKIATLRPPSSAYSLEKVENLKESKELTEEQKQAINQWIEDYKNWEEKSKGVDPVTSRRHREASNNLAMILIGLPLYFYHWNLIKKETKE